MLCGYQAWSEPMPDLTSLMSSYNFTTAAAACWVAMLTLCSLRWGYVKNGLLLLCSAPALSTLVLTQAKHKQPE